jgi:(1->4)-alpha-D-glucan 1-alpha-D-glucosylmutase
MRFEQDGRGRFRPASRYSRRALVTFDTHDLPTLRGFWEGEDLALRRSLGLIASDDALDRARAERSRERAALRRRLVSDGHLPRGGPEPSHPELCAAVNAFLCSTPCPLAGLSLDDLAGEREAVNLPGVPSDQHPSWTRRMSRSIDELSRAPDVARALEGASARARGRR